MSLVVSWPDGKLRIETSLLAKMLSGFASQDLVVVDRKQETVSVSTKRWWRWYQPRTISFARVTGIKYSFERESSPVFDSLEAQFKNRGAHFQKECFLIVLRLKEPVEDLVLARFTGRGVPKDLDQFEVSPAIYLGNQEETSLKVVNALSKAIGVPLI